MKVTLEIGHLKLRYILGKRNGLNDATMKLLKGKA